MFWDMFEALCRQSGKKPSRVGKEIGVSATAVSKWKEGTIPNGEILLKIADYFGCSVDSLLGRTRKSTPDRLIIVKEELNPELFRDIPKGETPNRHIFVSANESEFKMYTIKDEFIQVFDELSFEDKVEIMQFAIQKLKR